MSTSYEHRVKYNRISTAYNEHQVKYNRISTAYNEKDLIGEVLLFRAVVSSLVEDALDLGKYNYNGKYATRLINEAKAFAYEYKEDLSILCRFAMLDEEKIINILNNGKQKNNIC